LTVAERAGRGLDDALAAIAAAAQVGHQRAEMIGHHAAYFCRREMLDAAASNHVEEALTLAQRLGARRFEAEALACRGELRGVALAEGEALLAAGSPSHNHLQFRRDAIDACLDAEDWSGAEFHSDALESYTHEEPLPWSGFFIARGRALATRRWRLSLPV
jgi:hypothetical protein